MTNTTQLQLEKVVNELVTKYGKDKAIEIIKNKPSKGLFASTCNYPHGVRVLCNSEKGGIYLSRKSFN